MKQKLKTLRKNNTDIIYNNVSRYTGTYTQKAIGATTAIGAAYTGITASRFQGEIAEFIIYNRALSASEIDDVETYLNDKYLIY